MTPLKGETGEKVDNKGSFNATSFGGKEGGKVKIEVNGKLKDVCVQWVKGGFKPRCLNASPPHPISTADHPQDCPETRTHSAGRVCTSSQTLV